MRHNNLKYSRSTVLLANNSNGIHWRYTQLTFCSENATKKLIKLIAASLVPLSILLLAFIIIWWVIWFD